jgi:hypothetical protein
VLILTEAPQASHGIRCAVAAALAVVLLATGAGCGVDRAGRGVAGSCDEADPAVVKQVMAGARTNFRPTLPNGSTGVLVDHLEPLDSSVGRLPKKDRKFGADELVVLRVSTVLGGEDASGGIKGFDGALYLALDEDGKLLGPVGTFSTPFFDLESPGDPGWLPWGDKVENTKLGFDLFGCVNPS